MDDLNDLIDEISERLDMRNSPDGTLNKIEINDKIPIDIVKVMIDQVILLSKSELCGYLTQMLYDTMEMYHKLPAEKQVKVLPNKVKYITALGKELKIMSENHKSWNNPRKAMSINDDSQEEADYKTAHTYNLDDDDEVDVSDIVIHNDTEVEIDFDDEITNIHVELANAGLVDVDISKEVDDIDLSDFDIDDIVIHDDEEKYKEVKAEMIKFHTDERMDKVESELKKEYEIPMARHEFMELKRLYPRDQTIKQLLFTTNKGTIANIYRNETEWEAERSRLRKQSLINYNSSRHYCKHGKFNFYIIRHRVFRG